MSRFEPSGTSSFYSSIVLVRVVLKRTVVDSKCFNNLSGTHHQSHDDSWSGFGNVRKTLTQTITLYDLFCYFILREKHFLFSCRDAMYMLGNNFVALLYRLYTGFVWVLENLECPGILLWHFPGLESPGKRPLVLESSGNLFNSTKKYEVYGRQ